MQCPALRGGGVLSIGFPLLRNGKNKWLSSSAFSVQFSLVWSAVCVNSQLQRKSHEMLKAGGSDSFDASPSVAEKPRRRPWCLPCQGWFHRP